MLTFPGAVRTQTLRGLFHFTPVASSQNYCYHSVLPQEDPPDEKQGHMCVSAKSSSSSSNVPDNGAVQK